MKLNKIRFVVLSMTAIFMAVWFIPAFATGVVPYYTNISCEHGSSHYTKKRTVINRGADETYHWFAEDTYMDCDVSGCNGTFFTGQFEYGRERHNLPSRYSSDRCSSGWHYYYATCTACSRRGLFAKFKCNGHTHPSPYSIPLTQK